MWWRGLRSTASSVGTAAKRNGKTLRSQEWFDNPDNIGMTALYIERYLNFGLTREELQVHTSHAMYHGPRWASL